MGLGPHAAFIIASYAVAVVVIGALTGWVILDYRSQTRTLMDLEARGVTRRSAEVRPTNIKETA
jgi:heme exporter protein D